MRGGLQRRGASQLMLEERSEEHSFLISKPDLLFARSPSSLLVSAGTVRRTDQLAPEDDCVPPGGGVGGGPARTSGSGWTLGSREPPLDVWSGRSREVGAETWNWKRWELKADVGSTQTRLRLDSGSVLCWRVSRPLWGLQALDNLSCHCLLLCCWRSPAAVPATG